MARFQGNGFWNGVVSGITTASELDQRNRRLELEERRAEREQKEWDKKDALEAELKQATSDYTNQSALMSDQAQFEAGNASAVDSYLSESGIDPATASVEQKAQTQKDLGLASFKSNPLLSYEYKQRLASIYDKSGYTDHAEKIRKSATEEAAGQFMSSYLLKDRNGMMDFYNAFPNGHKIKDLEFGKDKDGNEVVNFMNTNGTTGTVRSTNLVAGALAKMSPPQAAQFLQREDASDIRKMLGINAIETRMAMAEQGNALRRDLDENRNMIRLLTGKGGVGGDVGTGSGRSKGAGSGKGSGEDSGYLGYEGVKDAKAFWDIMEPYAGKDAAPAILGADGKPAVDSDNKPIQADPTKYKAEFLDAMQNLATGKNGLNVNQAGAIAKSIVDGNYTSNKPKTSMQIDEKTGEISSYVTVNNRAYKYGNQEPTEAQIRAAMPGKAGDDFIIESKYRKAIDSASMFADLEAGKKVKVRGVYLTRDDVLNGPHFNGDIEKYKQAVQEANDNAELAKRDYQQIHSQYGTNPAAKDSKGNSLESVGQENERLKGAASRNQTTRPKNNAPSVASVQPGAGSGQQDNLPDYSLRYIGMYSRLENEAKRGTISPSDMNLLKKWREQKKSYSLWPGVKVGKDGGYVNDAGQSTGASYESTETYGNQ